LLECDFVGVGDYTDAHRLQASSDAGSASMDKLQGFAESLLRRLYFSIELSLEDSFQDGCEMRTRLKASSDQMATLHQGNRLHLGYVPSCGRRLEPIGFWSVRRTRWTTTVVRANDLRQQIDARLRRQSSHRSVSIVPIAH